MYQIYALRTRVRFSCTVPLIVPINFLNMRRTLLFARANASLINVTLIIPTNYYTL